jgi:hypothetical protein
MYENFDCRFADSPDSYVLGFGDLLSPFCTCSLQRSVPGESVLVGV